ncbi:MAG: hypothetical protein ACI88G_001906 [Woeseiaceae bacterium]|jgi:hypothetical protein
MIGKTISIPVFAAICISACSPAAGPSTFPDRLDLPASASLPEPLLMFDGETRIGNADEWIKKRRPELLEMFQHYVYGFAPNGLPIRHETTVIDEAAFDGVATLSEVKITIESASPIDIFVLLAVPNKVSEPAPVVLQLNKCGNQSVTDHEGIPVSKSWTDPNACNGANNNRAHRASRFQLEFMVNSGYAVATFHESDIDPDKADFSDGVHAAIPVDVDEEVRWGTIAAWSWGLRHVIDYLYDAPGIDRDRIVLFGHSRRGKTSLFTAAMDERVNLVVSHQSGTGGAAVSRSYNGESVKQINDQFPHWFNDVFPQFNENEEYLPIDQHELLALVAPRSALISNGADDLWADPAGTLQTVVGADSVWKLLGEPGYDQASPEQTDYSSSLAYYVRPGGHGVTLEDWQAIVRYANAQFMK